MAEMNGYLSIKIYLAYLEEHLTYPMSPDEKDWIEDQIKIAKSQLKTIDDEARKRRLPEDPGSGK